MEISRLLILAFIFVISCTDKNQNHEITLHPVPDKMPYANVEPEMVEVLDGGEVMDLLPTNLQALYRFLNQKNHEVHKHELNLLTTNRIDISTINDSTLLILEKDKHRLIQYDLKSDENEVIARQGRGPGDLFFSRELSVHNDKAIIAMQGFQISVFTCGDGFCEYEKTIMTDYNNYSATPLDDYLYFLGLSGFGRDQDPDPSNTNQYLIHKINYDGKKELSFFPVYQFMAPMVREVMNSGGQVRSFQEFETVAVTFDYHPYIYIHNSTGELTAKYEIPGYIQGYYEFEEGREGRWVGRTKHGSNSKILFTSKIENRWLFLRIREQRDVEFISLSEGFKGDEWYSYYAFDVDEKRLYKIGNDMMTSVNESRVLYVIDQGIILNEDGTLFLADL